MSDHEIVCGSCGGAAQGESDPNADSIIKCAGCGQEDRYETVMASAQQYATDAAAERLNKAMADATRGSKFISFTTTYRPAASYRWIARGLKEALS